MMVASHYFPINCALSDFLFANLIIFLIISVVISRPPKPTMKLEILALILPWAMALMSEASVPVAPSEIDLSMTAMFLADLMIFKICSAGKGRKHLIFKTPTPPSPLVRGESAALIVPMTEPRRRRWYRVFWGRNIQLNYYLTPLHPPLKGGLFY